MQPFLTNIISPRAGWCALSLGLTWAIPAAQAPHRTAGVAERQAIVLEHRDASVAFARHPDRCADDGTTLDALRGTVQRRTGEPGRTAIVYEGVLHRVTEQTICGSEPYPLPRSSPRASLPCRARLSGVGDVHVRLTIYRSGHDRQGAWIVLTPTDVMASVTGNCRAGEMHEMRAAYAERTTIDVSTPVDPLVPGRYQADPRPGELGRWWLTVESMPWPVS